MSGFSECVCACMCLLLLQGKFLVRSRLALQYSTYQQISCEQILGSFIAVALCPCTSAWQLLTLLFQLLKLTQLSDTLALLDSHHV